MERSKKKFRNIPHNRTSTPSTCPIAPEAPRFPWPDPRAARPLAIGWPLLRDGFSLELEYFLFLRFAVVVKRPGGPQRFGVHEGERGLVHVHVLVGLGVREADELEL